MGSDFPALIAGADLVLSVVPTQFLRSTWADLAGAMPEGVPVVSLSKGIENRTLRRPTEILAELLGDRPLAVLSGPSHAEEVVKGLPTTVVVGSTDAADAGIATPAPARRSRGPLRGRDLPGEPRTTPGEGPRDR